MRLTPEDLTVLGDDARLVQFIDTAFGVDSPERVGVAVSGGGDSMALLHVAHVWAGLADVPIEAVTVNHGLRAEAAQEAAMVAAFCETLEIPHEVLDWNGAAAAGNVQSAARAARYDLMSRWATDNCIGGMLLGHTADDVAETFLMRLARKSGVDGLAAMPTRFRHGSMRWARPLRRITRAALRDYAQRHNVPWVDDPSNEDLMQLRPRARKALAALAPLGIDVETLNETAKALAGTKDALAHWTKREARRLVVEESGDVLIPHGADPSLHPQIRRRLMRSAVQSISGAPYGPRETALESLDVALIDQDRHTIGGCLVTKEGAYWRFARELSACPGPTLFSNRSMGKVWDKRWLVEEEAESNHQGSLCIRALGEAITEVPDWRDAGVPRTSLMASPAVFDGETLISAPVAGYKNGFEARIVADFASFLVSR